MPLRLVFMGTPDFAAATLSAVAEAGHEIVAIYTQPPRPAGRRVARGDDSKPVTVAWRPVFQSGRSSGPAIWIVGAEAGTPSVTKPQS